MTPRTAVEGTDELDYSEALEVFGLRFKPANSAPNDDDEILAIDHIRVRADRLDERFEQYAPGDRIAMLVARRDRLLSLDVLLGAEPSRTWRLESRPT